LLLVQCNSFGSGLCEWAKLDIYFILSAAVYYTDDIVLVDRPYDKIISTQGKCNPYKIEKQQDNPAAFLLVESHLSWCN